jgi:protoheme IX farnesyltransferase
MQAAKTREAHTARRTVRQYVSLTKPGVLFGNVITGVAGFCLASAWLRQFDAGLFLATIGGMTLIIASACVLNNVLDRDIDRIMARTKKRAVASGMVPPRRAVVFSILLGVFGVAMLSAWTNWLVVGIGVAGFIVYVWLYGALAKRQSIHGTLVGSISGAAPILAGYVAASGRLDMGALLVFLALFFWQFPEFFSIAVYRRNEYSAAGVPVITVKRSVAYTKRRIFVYAILFLLSALLLTSFHYTGYVYAVCMALIGGYWLIIGFDGFRQGTDDDRWARRMFHASINVLVLYSLLIAIGPLLP